MPNSVLLIVLISVIGGFLYAAYELHVKSKLKEKRYSADGELKKEIEELKERIAVLEKIVTDKNYDLKSQIDALDKAS